MVCPLFTGSGSIPWGRAAGILLVLLVPLLAMGSIGDTGLRAQPALLQIAAQHPDATVRVIVQKAVRDNRVEELVVHLGGVITKDLHIINAFAAELPARVVPELAQADGVRWISLDALVQPADSTTRTRKFTTWATRLGSAVPNGFTDAKNILSAVGRNNTYGYGSNVKGAFTGFSAEFTPGYVVRKVEAVLRAYVPTALSATADPVLTVYVQGVNRGSFPLRVDNLNTHVGPDNAGTLHLDITGSRAWSWTDFSTLELVIDQSAFASDQVVFYDAIGVRVTSVHSVASNLDDKIKPAQLSNTSEDPGYLGVSSTDAESNAPAGPIDTSQLRNVYNTVVRATDVWNEGPAYLQGQDITVAVVDSGVLNTLNLQGRVVANVNFNAAYHDSTDRYGHGTHVAGIVGDDGTVSGGKYIGIAPKAKILNVRISDDQGMATESDVVNSLQWINDNRTAYNIRVVNLSLNSSLAQSYLTSPMDAAVEILWFNGIVVVVSAGNHGGTILYPPANDPFVITVGATQDMGTATLDDDVVAPFSDYGTTENGFSKPELVAPGHNIIAYLPDNPQLTASQRHPDHQVNADYFRMSGTSMSAPIVAGAVVLLLQDEPGLNPDQVKYRLMATAARSNRWPGYIPQQAGAGLLDVYAAVHGTTTESANLGIAASALLWTGSSPITWGSVNWGSVNWGSVNWGSVNWGSVNWGSVNWGSDYWGP